MSAIALPMIHSLNVSSGQSEMINIEQVSNVTRTTTPIVPGVNAPQKFQIGFQFGNGAGNGTPNDIQWKYDDEATRDADFVLLLAAVSTAL